MKNLKRKSWLAFTLVCLSSMLNSCLPSQYHFIGFIVCIITFVYWLYRSSLVIEEWRLRQ